MNNIYNNCLVTLDEERYSFLYLDKCEKIRGIDLIIHYGNKKKIIETTCNSNDFGVLVSDKECYNDLFCVVNPTMILQISDDEFLISWRENNNQFEIQHLYYNRDTFKTIIRYDKKYSVVGEEKISLKNDLVIIEEDSATTIYNYKTNRSLELNNMKIIDNSLLDGQSCLLGKIDISERESIIFGINSNSLEFDTIYSTMQNRYIQIVKDKVMNFKERFAVTLEKEVYKYLEYIEEYEEFMNNKKLDRVCKRLIKNNRV